MKRLIVGVLSAIVVMGATVAYGEGEVVCPAWNFWANQPDCRVVLGPLTPYAAREFRIAVDDPTCRVGSIDHLRVEVNGQPVTGSVVTQQVAGGVGLVMVVNLGHVPIDGTVGLRVMPHCPPF